MPVKIMPISRKGLRDSQDLLVLHMFGWVPLMISAQEIAAGFFYTDNPVQDQLTIPSAIENNIS